MVSATEGLSLHEINQRLPIGRPTWAIHAKSFQPAACHYNPFIAACELNAKQTAIESTLVRDFMLLVEFDPDFLSYEVQPVRIDYLSVDGQTCHCTPDILVTYSQTSTYKMLKPPLLVEIKYRRDLFESRQELKPKFRAARRYAKEQGWIFKIITAAMIEEQE